MKKSIILKNQEIEYNLKKSSRAKRLRIAICCDTSITVTQPYFLSERTIENFLHEKAGWLLQKIKYFKEKDMKLLPGNSHRDFISNKKAAYSFVKNRIEIFNQKYNLKFNRISVKRLSSRWGSCSRQGNLNFNYRIIFLPQELADYIVVHELCHLKEFNHSKNFWNLVSQTVPNYKNIRRELKVKYF